MSGNLDDQLISNLFPDTRMSPSNSTDRVVISSQGMGVGGFGNYHDGLRAEISELEERRDILAEEVMWLERQRDSRVRRGGSKTSFSARLTYLEYMQFMANKTYAKMERARYYFDPNASDDDAYEGSLPSPNNSKQASSSSSSAFHQPGLQAMELKNNLVRAKKGFRPITAVCHILSELSSWKNPISSFSCMCFYFYLVYTKRLTLFCAVLTLGFFIATYLDKMGLHLVTLFDEPETEEEKKSDLKDLWKGAKQALLRVQLLAGDTADSLEKVANFCQWEDKEGANRLVSGLVAMILMLLFLPSGVAQQVVLAYMGFQVFIESPLFRKFPRLKRRFSFVRKVWKRLPNHAAKARRKNPSQATPYKIHDIPVYNQSTVSSSQPPSLSSSPSGNSLSISGPKKVRKLSTESLSLFTNSLHLPTSSNPGTPTEPNNPLSEPLSKSDENLRSLLDFYNIDESPLPSLRGGVICSNRCKRSLFSLAGEIGGRLYATKNHLIFSPNFRKRDGFVLNMEAVKSVVISAAKVEKIGILKHSVDLTTVDDESFFLTIWTLRVKDKQKTNELLQWLRARVPEKATSYMQETDGVSHNTLSVRPRISYQATNDSASEDELESTVFLTN